MKISKKLLCAALLFGLGISGLQAQPPVKLKRVEYYVDSDPGYGNAKSVSIASDTVIRNVQVTLNPAEYTTGVHIFGIRALSASGKWSLDNTWFFVKPTKVVSPAKLTRIEYYIDTDPGYGKADTIKNLSVNSTELKTITIPVNPSLLASGVHMLGIRARDANGKWSLDNTWFFIKPQSPSSLVKLNRIEYYIDNDPGYGKADTIKNLVVNDTALKMISIPIDPSKLGTGAHLFGIRARDATSKWSLDNVWLFIKPDVKKDRPLLKQVEYFISKLNNGVAQDKDPGYGKATPVAINDVTQLADFKTPINVSGFDTGAYRLFIRSRDANGAWSLDNYFDFTISPKTDAPSIVINSVATKAACSGDVLKVSFDAKGSFKSSNNFKVQLSDSLGSFSSPTEIGSVKDTMSRIINCKLPSHLQNGVLYKVRVISTNPTLISLNTKDSITIHNRPFAQTISGPATVNTALSYAYSVPAITGSAWKWIAPAATISALANSANVTWNIPGTQLLKVVERDSYGCAGDTSSKVVTVYKVGIDSVIVSDSTPCPGQVMTITASVSGLFNSGNVFKAQLSSSTGSFSSPKDIGSIALSSTGNNQHITIQVNVGSISNGTKYRIRVISSSPKDTSADNGTYIVISKPNLGNDTAVFVCAGGTTNLTTVYILNGYSPVNWNTPNPASAPAGTYQLIVTNAGGCSDTAKIVVSERTTPAPLITPSGNVTICPSDSVMLSVTTAYTAYVWNTGESTRSIMVKTAGDYKVTVTDGNGCQGTSAITTVHLDTCGKPGSLVATNVTASAATLSWNGATCAKEYELRYKQSSSTVWNTIIVSSPLKALTALSPSTKYNWEVRTVCKDLSKSGYTAGNNFTTTAAQLFSKSNGSLSNGASRALKAFVTPNPANSFSVLRIAYAAGTAHATLFDVHGKMLWKSYGASGSSIHIPLKLLADGMYLVKVTDTKESLIISLVKE